MSGNVFCDDFDAKIFLGALVRELERSTAPENIDRVTVSTISRPKDAEAWKQVLEELKL